MELKIEKWIYGGEGLARLAPDVSGRSKAVFVSFVLPGELVEADIGETKPGFTRAHLTNVKESSQARITPPCPYFSRCGGCQYQHADYRSQLAWKRDILVETLERIAKLTLQQDVHLHSAAPYHYRNRTRLKVRSEPDFAIGYYKFGTNDLLPVTECPISSPLIQRAIQAMWTVGAQTSVSGLREVQFFANATDDKVIVEFYTDRESTATSLQPLAEALRGELAAIVGVVVFRWSPSTDDERGSRLANARNACAAAFGDESLQYGTKHGIYRVSAGSFFQTNRFLIDELVSTAVADAKGTTALDLYAGTGLFCLPLAKRFERVIAVEASPFSFLDLQRNVAANVTAVQAATEKYLDNIGRGPGFDLVLVDPPRSGMGEQTARKLGQAQVPGLTYVSCDPATLARDLRVLSAAGFRIESLHLVDLFPQTFHMETVVQLVR